MVGAKEGNTNILWLTIVFFFKTFLNKGFGLDRDYISLDYRSTAQEAKQSIENQVKNSMTAVKGNFPTNVILLFMPSISHTNIKTIKDLVNDLNLSALGSFRHLIAETSTQTRCASSAWPGPGNGSSLPNFVTVRDKLPLS